MENNICQSCGMPMTEEKLFGINEDGTQNMDYCCYCYPNGAFSKDETMEEMLESCIPFMIGDGGFPDTESARGVLLTTLPSLKRWKKTE